MSAHSNGRWRDMSFAIGCWRDGDPFSVRPARREEHRAFLLPSIAVRRIPVVEDLLDPVPRNL